MVSAYTALVGQDTWAGAASGTLVDKLYTALFAFGTESAIDRIKLFFFLFEIIDIDRNRSGKYNE